MNIVAAGRNQSREIDDGFLGRHAQWLPRSIAVAAREMPEYAETAGRRRRYREASDGQQPGDPLKAIAVMMQALDAERTPLHLPLGPNAFRAADAKLANFCDDIETWRSVAIATDFDPE